MAKTNSFEYRVVSLPHPLGDEVDLTETETFLNEYGADGWELQSVQVKHAQTVSIMHEIFYFKRMLIAAAEVPVKKSGKKTRR